MNKIINMILTRRNFILFSLIRVFTMVLTFVANILIVNKISVADYGTYSLVFMVVGLFTTFGFSWSSSSIVYFGSKEEAQTGSLNKTFWARNIITGVSLLIVFLFGVFFRNYINEYLGIEATGLLLLWLFVSVCEDYLSNYFLAIKRQLLSGILSVTAKLILIILIIISPLEIKQLLIINIISHASVLFYFVFIEKDHISHFEYDKEMFKEILSFSLWQLFGFSGLYLINFGDIAVIKHFMTIPDVAIYDAAYKLFNSIASFSFVVSSYYASTVTTSISNNDRQSFKQFFYKERFFVFLLSFVAHILVMLISKPLILKLYGLQYSQSVIIFNILMLGSIVRYFAVFYTVFYNAVGDYKVLQIINIIRSFLNIGLNVILIKYFGLIGPAIATSLSILLTTLFSVYYCEKRIKNMIYDELQV